VKPTVELKQMSNPLPDFVANESGAAAVEYALITALVSVAVIAVFTTLGTNLANKFQETIEMLFQQGTHVF